MYRLCLLAVCATEVFCGDMGFVSPAEAAMTRIIGLGHAINDPDVQWLMKQTDLLLFIVSHVDWRATMEERHNFINVIERFVSATISGPLGVDIRQAAATFERFSIDFRRGEIWQVNDMYRDLSALALSLAHDLRTNAPSLPTLLSDPDFPMDTDPRILLDSIASIERRLGGSTFPYFRPIYIRAWSSAEAGYLEMLLDVFTKVEDRYTRLCQQTGVDVQHTYRPMRYLNRNWGDDIQEDTKLVHSKILPMIDDPQTIEFARTVGPCVDVALRHHRDSIVSSFRSLDTLGRYIAENSDLDPHMVCDSLMAKGFARRPQPGSTPAPLVDGGHASLTDFFDGNPPIPMESADARTIRVTRLVEVVALGVPEIREVFLLIDGPASMLKFERILLENLFYRGSHPNEGVGMDRLAYNFARSLRIPILHLPMMRERYFNSLSLEQFHGFRRIISCMARLEPLVGNKATPDRYIRYALQHPDEIEFISRGLEALTRLYRKFQQDPIWSGEYPSVARHRTVVGFLPAYLVFDPSHYFNSENFRQALEWVIAHECASLSLASLNRLVAGDLWLEDPMDTVLKFLGGNSLPEFDGMVFALDNIFRELVAHYGNAYNDRLIGALEFEIPKRIFAAVMRLGGRDAIEAPLRAQLLRIVPVLMTLMRAAMNGQLTPPEPGPNHSDVVWTRTQRLHRVLADLERNDHDILEEALDALEQLIPPPQTNPVI